MFLFSTFHYFTTLFFRSDQQAKTHFNNGLIYLL